VRALLILLSTGAAVAIATVLYLRNEPRWIAAICGAAITLNFLVRSWPERL
jgi:hypothetical protein